MCLPQKKICLRIAAKRPTYKGYFFFPLHFSRFPHCILILIFLYRLCLHSQNMQETTDANIAHDFFSFFLHVCLFPSLQIMFALRNYATSDENTRARIGKADGMLQCVLQRVAVSIYLYIEFFLREWPWKLWIPAICRNSEFSSIFLCLLSRSRSLFFWRE